MADIVVGRGDCCRCQHCQLRHGGIRKLSSYREFYLGPREKNNPGKSGACGVFRSPSNNRRTQPYTWWSTGRATIAKRTGTGR